MKNLAWITQILRKNFLRSYTKILSGQPLGRTPYPYDWSNPQEGCRGKNS